MTFEVQQFTLCQRWVNTWAVLHEDGSSEPETFATETHAEATIIEILDEIEDEIAVGQRNRGDGYSRDEFRIVKAGAA
jgi:hypothetical protein